MINESSLTVDRYVSQPMRNVWHPDNNAFRRSELPDRTNLVEYIHSYFQCVHPYQANGFLHLGALKQEMHEDRAYRPLLLAICAVTRRFMLCSEPHHNHPPAYIRARQQSKVWADLALVELMAAPSCVDAIATALILTRQSANESTWDTTFLLSGLIARMIQRVKMAGHPREIHESETFVKEERNRRLLFAAYCADRKASHGAEDHVLLRVEWGKLPLPCEDHLYQ